MLRPSLIAFALFLTACSGTSDYAERRTLTKLSLPPVKTFSPTSYALPRQSNAELARDFLELSFQMESGRRLTTFSRFEGPITVRMTGDIPASFANADLESLLGRLRSEARIDISRVTADVPANITIEAVPRRALQRVVPSAACFVVPNAQSWEDFKRLRRSAKIDWTQVRERTHAAIFLPGDVAPQEFRDCLHEELAQALGPLNDLYRLPESVFNDDNFHTVLTGFDMTMLQVTYSPRLRSGMTKTQVANQLPIILNAINPTGRSAGIAAPIETPREWITAIETALTYSKPEETRLRAAQTAVEIAEAEGWSDARMGFSLFVVARLSLARQSQIALASFFTAASLYGNDDTTALQSAHIGMQLAAYALSSGDGEATVAIVDTHIPIVARAQNAALLSTMLLLKAEALTLMNRPQDAAIVREDGLGWARYGFGSDAEVGSRLSEIASLRPLRAGDDFGS